MSDRPITTTNPAYRRHLPRTTAADAEAEPQSDRVFDEEDVMNGRAPKAAPVKPSVAFTFHGILDGFPFDMQCTGTAEQFVATARRLRELGAVPPTPAARAEVEAEKERSAPVCEFHGAMKESSKKPGTYYCPAKMGDGSYCKSRG